MNKCKHSNASELEGGFVRLIPIKWCPDCGALFIRFETQKGTVSRRPRWLLPKGVKP